MLFCMRYRESAESSAGFTLPAACCFACGVVKVHKAMQVLCLAAQAAHQPHQEAHLHESFERIPLHQCALGSSTLANIITDCLSEVHQGWLGHNKGR